MCCGLRPGAENAMNYSLRSLLVFIAAFAIVIACLAFPEPLVGDFFYSLGLLLIAFATLAAIYFRGTLRAYWVGFLVLFAGYYAHTVWPSEVRTSWIMVQRMGGIGTVSQEIITSRLLSAAYEGMHGPAVGRFMAPRPMMPGNIDPAKYIAFMTVGHTVIALLLGLLGGAIAQRFATGVAAKNVS
jgi:hypothetical protein